MGEDKRDFESKVKQAETLEHRGNVLTGLLVISFFLLLAEFFGNVLPIGLPVPAVLVVTLLFWTGKTTTAASDIWSELVNQHIDSAEKLHERAEKLERENRDGEAESRCEEAIDHTERAAEFIEKASYGDSETDEERVLNVRSAVGRTLDRIQNQRALREQAIEPTKEAEAAYETATEAFKADRLDDVVESLESARSLEREARSSLEEIDMLSGERGGVDPDHVDRIKTARERFLEGVTSYVSQAVERHDEGRARLAAQQYEQAVDLLEEAEKLLDDIWRIGDETDLPYCGEIVSELTGESDDLQTLPATGEHRGKQLREAGFGSIEDVRRASRGELTNVDGIGTKTADRIKQYLAEFSIQQSIEDRLSAVQSDREKAIGRYTENRCSAVEAHLESVDGALARGEMQDARQSLTAANKELDGLLDRLAAWAHGERTPRITNLRQQIDDRTEAVRSAGDGAHLLEKIDTRLELVEANLEDGQWKQALSKLSDVRAECQGILEEERPYPTDEMLQQRLNRIEEYRKIAERRHSQREITDLLDECRAILDETTDANGDAEDIRERIEPKLGDARELLSESLPEYSTLTQEIEAIEERMPPVGESTPKAEQVSERDEEVTSESDASTAAFAELTNFQRDLLVVVAGHDGETGMAIKRELNAYYDDPINHSRLYPNLDTLVDQRLVDKFSRDERSNGYRLTDRGWAIIESRISWERTRAPDEEAGEESSDEKQRMTAAIADLESELGRMPKRNEFLDRTEWTQGDLRTAFKSWNAALDSAGISVEAALLSELERVAAVVDGEPTSLDMNERGAYNSGKYSDHFGSWADAVSSADLGSTSFEEADSSNNVEVKPNSRSSPAPGRPEFLDAYATFDDISRESRFGGEVAIQVVEIHSPDQTKDAQITVRDATGEMATFNVWSKHDCEFEWAVDEWYVLSEVLLKEWERGGKIVLNLSSSRDTTVTSLGEATPMDDDPSPKREQTTDIEEFGGDAEASVEQRQSGDDGNDSTDNDGVLEEIVAEFDDDLV